MSAYTNRKIVLSKRPQGELRDGDLTLKEEPVRELRDGEILIKTLWLSLDPYMRPRMNDSKGYMDPVAIGATMVGESVGRSPACDDFTHQWRPGGRVIHRLQGGRCVWGWPGLRCAE